MSEARSGPRGGVSKKYSVSLPEALAEEVRERIGPGAFSSYVATAIQRQLENDKLGEFVDAYIEEHGPLPQEFLDEAAEAFRDADRLNEAHQGEQWHANRSA
ncbi:hypothetical protein [Embleya sp. NBC_00896]|uniref:hypothetical protein n=1 Tax=Embleya sp. NBC_00896 TaxID=2975961 RepID=UPI003862E529|nr:hypothetical protein OG928_19940 [Embleya sp. NBC_00896]